MIKKSLKVLSQDILRPINTAAIMIMGVYTVFWGLWVASPFWDVFSRAPVYHYFMILPETFWGIVAITAGVIMVYGVLERSYHSLTTGSMIGFLHWLVISVFFLVGDWQNTGWVTYTMITVYCAFVWLNIRVNR